MAPTGESGSHFSVHPLYNLTFPTPLSTVRWSRLQPEPLGMSSLPAGAGTAI